MKRFLLPVAIALLAYGLAQNTTIDVNTTGVSADGVFFEVNAPANINFVFDFTQPGTDLSKANWTAFENIVRNNRVTPLKPTGQESYTITVLSNAPYQLVVGVPTVTGTGFDLSRYFLSITFLGSPGRAERLLGDITAPWTAVSASPGRVFYTLTLYVFVNPNDVPSNYNQAISIPLILTPTP